MATVHHITNAITAIASKVNAHQILIEDLRKTSTEGQLAHALPEDSSFSVRSSTNIDHHSEVQKMVDSGVAALKDEVEARQAREKAMLEASINHSLDQKIAKAVADVDHKGAIALVEDRIKRIEERIEALLNASAALPQDIPAPASCDKVPDETPDQETGEPAPAAATTTASKPRPSRRRGKAASADSPPGTLTLE